MLVHKCQHESSTLFTLFDSEERVVIHPTYYLRQLERLNRPESSRRLIASVLNIHCGWVERSSYFEGHTVDEALAVIESEDILGWLEDQRAAGISPRTLHNREVLLRGLYKWLTTDEARRVRTDIPWDERTITKNPHKLLPRFVTVEQLIRLLKGLHNESQRAAVHFMYDTGVRVSELERITNRYLPKLEDWPEEMNYYPLVVPGSKPYDGSKFKFRTTIISRAALARVNRYHNTRRYLLAKGYGIDDPNKPIFMNIYGRDLTADSIRKAIECAWIRQGGGKKEVSPHRLRHGTGFSVLRSELGKDLQDNLLILKSMLGHADISTTEIYAAVPIAALQSIMAQDQVKLRHEEAQRIYDETYLPEHKHTERRGHKR